MAYHPQSGIETGDNGKTTALPLAKSKSPTPIVKHIIRLR
jgi:hypothetical protein